MKYFVEFIGLSILTILTFAMGFMIGYNRPQIQGFDKGYKEATEQLDYVEKHGAWPYQPQSEESLGYSKALKEWSEMPKHADLEKRMEKGLIPLETPTALQILVH